MVRESSLSALGSSVRPRLSSGAFAAKPMLVLWSCGRHVDYVEDSTSHSGMQYLLTVYPAR